VYVRQARESAIKHQKVFYRRDPGGICSREEDDREVERARVDVIHDPPHMQALYAATY